jgi:hypothetical protein
MITLDKSINAIDENDLTKISGLLFESFSINRQYKRESLVNYKEDLIDSFMELLNKLLAQQTGLSKERKLDTIDLLDKLKTQKENLEMIKSNISLSDIEQASARLTKKTQSAFELK